MKTVHHINLNHHLAAYAARVQAEEARREAIREAARQGSPLPAPATVWAISDRH